jgi:hypothetical protein
LNAELATKTQRHERFWGALLANFLASTKA